MVGDVVTFAAARKNAGINGQHVYAASIVWHGAANGISSENGASET